MQVLKKQLPPLDPLIAFEAAARHLSFTRAARELNLSQAAVSQQIRNLEEKLGLALFIRSHRAVQLSAKGREYQHTVSQVFQQLASATAELKGPASQTRISVSADQSMASMWLMARLPGFQRRFPEISVRLLATDDETDCLGEDIQLAMIHGNGKWPGYRCSKLFGEEIFPVCSPGYLAGMSTEPDCNSLVNETLLDLDDIHWDWMNWRTWLSRNDVHLPARHRGLRINSYPLLIDAARNGQGVALGWRYLVDRDIEAGTLVRLLDEFVSTELGYYLVWPDHRELAHGVACFREWCLQVQTGNHQQPGSTG